MGTNAYTHTHSPTHTCVLVCVFVCVCKYMRAFVYACTCAKSVRVFLYVYILNSEFLLSFQGTRESNHNIKNAVQTRQDIHGSITPGQQQRFIKSLLFFAAKNERKIKERNKRVRSGKWCHTCGLA
jgi:hypothetical protein